MFLSQSYAGVVMLSLCLSFASFTVSANERPLLDCPLRDAAFGFDIPLIDILLSSQAKALVEQEVPGLLTRMPSQWLKTEAPAFSTTVSLRTLASMRRTPEDQLKRLERQLATLAVTDADRRARCVRYDANPVSFEVSDAEVQLLIFDKINGYDHGPSVTAATDAIKSIAAQQGWGVHVTSQGGAFTAETLAKFDVVIWNNVSGDVLTLNQRQAFKDYIEQGGGYVGLHGSGGDSMYFWDWYANALLGARFIGHTSDPQFQEALITIESAATGIGQRLQPSWTMSDEWYSFEESPRLKGAHIVATLDESTYSTKGYGGQDLRMGEDHPIVWAQCVAAGRAFYSAIGHMPEVYDNPNSVELLQDGIAWAAGQGKAICSP